MGLKIDSILTIQKLKKDLPEEESTPKVKEAQYIDHIKVGNFKRGNLAEPSA